jgi:hypothetical protein
MKKIFISYAHKDEDYKNQFEIHLSGLKRQNLIDVWTDRQVLIGEKWDEKIRQRLITSDIVIFLISSDFLASEYINEVEIKKTIARHKNKEILIAPIFLRPCDFESSILSDFQGVPRDKKFIVTWDNIDSAFLKVIEELKKIIVNFQPIEKPTIVASIPDESTLKPCDTPPDIAKWVGRNDELNLLNSSDFKVIFITGIGGQGKSSLAAMYVYNQFDNNSFESWDWRDLKEEENRLKTKLIEIIQRYSNSGFSLRNLKDASFDELVDLFFKTIGERKILFIFDNIDFYIDYETLIPVEGFRQLIHIALNRKHNCKFIFTCRPFIKKADVGFYQIELTGLKYENTATLLDKYNIGIKQNHKEKLYRKLHKITNGHPLWLNLLGAQAVCSVEKLEKFIENISEHTDFDEGDISKILSDEIIGALWKSLNYKQKKLLRYLSEIIKAEEIENLSKMIENELKFNQFKKALNRLKLLNLVVTKTQKSNKEEIELHPLVKNYVKGKYPLNKRSKYISIIIDYYTNVTYLLKEGLSGNESLCFYENWTNKVELAINKNDFPLALSTLQEITDSILTAGYFEEYFRVSKVLFNKIDFTKSYTNETPYLISQIKSFVELSSEINEFYSARFVLDNFKKIINNKSKDYIIYCKLECSYYWHKLENKDAIKWGEKALSLVNNSKIEIDLELEHVLNLAKRDSREETHLATSLIYFIKGRDINELIDSQIDCNLSAHYYGNLGRCYFFLKEYKTAKALYLRAFHLSYKEDISSKFMNRGFVSYWIAQVLQKMNENKMAFFFYLNCIYYWEKHSPHRAQRVEEEINILKREIPDIDDIMKLDNDTIENKCRRYNEKQIKLTMHHK